MLKTVLKREVLHNLYSLRFALSFVLVLVVFIAHSLSFARSHAASLEKYSQARTLALKAMEDDAGVNATRLAVTRRAYDLRPRDNAFIADAKEKYLPNSIIYSAWNVFGFLNKTGSANPFLARYDELNWTFIASLIISFVAILFTFDSVSGEKESRTLALTLSNPVSRGTLLWGKYLSAVLCVLAIVFPGVLLSLLLLLLTGAASWSAGLAAESAGYLAATGLLAAAMGACGLLASVVSRRSNVSLLLALSIWLLLAVVIPNASGFLAKALFPIEGAGTVEARVAKALEDLNRAAPKGSWSMQGSNPFMPLHELRADRQRIRLAAEKVVRDANYQEMFRQLELTRTLTSVSPVAAYGFLAEVVAAGGYARLRKVWDDLHTYQARFEQFFKGFDALDPKSPHWYNPNEDVSTTQLKAAFETVPQFIERPMIFAARLRAAGRYVALLAFSTCLVFLVSFVVFVRYDVR